MRHDDFAAVEEGFHVDADQAVEFLFGDFVAGGGFLDDARVVDDYVELAVGRECGGEGGVPGREERDVAWDGGYET